jgi:hypothetical protein
MVSVRHDRRLQSGRRWNFVVISAAARTAHVGLAQ